MFTGIIQSIGAIVQIEPREGDLRLSISLGEGLSTSLISLGDSVAVNGVCLTVVELDKHSFVADVSRETLSCTTLGKAVKKDPVNLELALLPTTRLGGHIVSGHVDGIGVIRERRNDARSQRVVIEAPIALAKYIAQKGAICVDGVSLTVNEVDGHHFSVNIVPHTLLKTTLGNAKIGKPVNVEVDILSRYLERLLLGEKMPDATKSVTIRQLRETGFVV